MGKKSDREGTFLGCVSVMLSLMLMMTFTCGQFRQFFPDMLHVIFPAAAGPPPYVWYNDRDGDGYGDRVSLYGSGPGPGFSRRSGDCADFDASRNPSARETCNGRDDNCNGRDDEGLPIQSWYLDSDLDGYGMNSTGARTDCKKPEDLAPDMRYVAVTGDCAEWDASQHPGAPELCDNEDNNCNGQIDEGLPVQSWYADGDYDGYGRAEVSRTACSRPGGSDFYVARAGDCEDWNFDVNPAMWEVPRNYQDDDCDGLIDEDN